MTNLIKNINNQDIFNNNIINKETTQYITTLFVSLYASFCLYQFCSSEKDIKWLNCLFIIVIIYLAIHLCFVEKIELKIHHVLFIFVIGWYFLCSNIGPIIKNELYILALAEVSNIFLSIRNLIRHPTIIQFVSLPEFIQPINDGLFAITFFYARIYLYFKYIITNQELFENITKYNQFFMCDKIVIAILFGLFILNLYWFLLICSGVIKMIGFDSVVKKHFLEDNNTAFFKKIEDIKAKNGFKMAPHP